MTRIPAQGSSAAAIRPSAWAAAMGRVTNYLMNDCGGGRRVLKLAWVINFQKLSAIPLLAVLIARYHNTSAAAWIYFAMQSSYGLVWIIKDLAFPDSNFHKRITLGAGIASLLAVLGWYWVFGWLLISAVATPAYPLPAYAWFSLCISLCILGCGVMIASDAQKYFTLRLKHDLITDGMYVHSAPQLPRRDDDLRQLCPDGMALATVCSAYAMLDYVLCSRPSIRKGLQDSQVGVCFWIPWSRLWLWHSSMVMRCATDLYGGIEAGSVPHA